MMDLATINALSRDAARKARRAKAQPFVFTPEQVYAFRGGDRRGIRIPNLGDHRPKGWKLVARLFVDKSGWGAEGEAAMTQRQFAERVQPGFGYGMIEEGEFQCYVGEFTRVQ